MFKNPDQIMLCNVIFQWSNIFPTEQVTQQQSALFVKKLLAVSVSSITYLRAIFPEHAFGDRCLEGRFAIGNDFISITINHVKCG